MTDRSRKAKGALCAAAGGMCWGLSGSMGQYLFQYKEMSAFWLVPVRLFFAGVILMIYCLVKHRKALIGIWKPKRDRIWLLVYAVSLSTCQFFYFLTIQLSTAGVGTILQDLSPVLILACSCVRTKSRPKARQVLAIVLALAGVVLITTHGNFTDTAVPGEAVLAGLASAVFVAVYNELPQDFLHRYPIIVLQAWAFFLGGMMLFFAFRSWKIPYRPDAAALGGIVFVVLVGNIIAFTSYMTGVALIGPDLAVLYGFAEPLTAAAVTLVLFHSPFTVYDGLGFAAVFLMLVLISAPQRDA